jgi:hypothetical protein
MGNWGRVAANRRRCWPVSSVPSRFVSLLCFPLFFFFFFRSLYPLAPFVVAARFFFFFFRNGISRFHGSPPTSRW